MQYDEVKAATPFEFLCLTGLVTSDGSEAYDREYGITEEAGFIT